MTHKRQIIKHQQHRLPGWKKTGTHGWMVGLNRLTGSQSSPFTTKLYSATVMGSGGWASTIQVSG